jgi:hypothetical protein
MDLKLFGAFAKAVAPVIRSHVKDSVDAHDQALRAEFAALESRIARLEAESSTEKSIADSYDGPWQFGTEYARGRLVTDRGSLWLSLGDNEKNTRPGSGPTWRLVSKNGIPQTGE